MSELEEAVRARWDREALAVYGDHLMAIGDPRGELVAMDLRIDEEGASPAVLARRDELIAAWFGDRLPPGIVRYGFVDVDATGADSSAQLAIALQGPAAPYVRSVALAGPPGSLARSLALLAQAERPWLMRLVVRQWGESRRATIDDDHCAELVAASPELADVEVTGRRVFGELVHPSVRTLRISGFDAIDAMTHAGPALPVAQLDFAFHCPYAAEHAAPSAPVLRSLLEAGRLPALVDLDLSRNGVGHVDPDRLGGDLDVFSFLGNLALRRQLETLRLPALLAPADVAKLQHALDTMPALRELTVYGAPKPLAHATAKIGFASR